MENREIKFRGLKNKKWIYGYYNYEPKSNIAEIIFNDAGISVKKESVGQFTGLKDKNGVEIYEGDILSNNDRKIGIVEFYNGSFCFKSNGYYILKDSLNHLIVIGNIHEHKNLL